MAGGGVTISETRTTVARDDQSKGEATGCGPAGSSPQRQVRRRQQEILDAAAEIFREKGYEATSTQDIADAVGLLKGSLYYYIDSKEDLLAAIIDDAYTGALQALEQAKATPGNALQKIRSIIESYVDYFIANQVKMAVLFRDFRSLSDERQQIIAGERDQYLDEVRSLLRQGQAEGLVAPDLDPKLASIGITGMVNSLSQWYHPSGPSTPAEISEAFARLVVAGVSAGNEGSWGRADGVVPPGALRSGSPRSTPARAAASAGSKAGVRAASDGTSSTDRTGKSAGRRATGRSGGAGTAASAKAKSRSGR
ncbi:MAG: TetR/AcrR family transcriptional regulator [Actinomycetota bacterium]|nr:TetR/AcrR family transcriptional regulator [Actinomycetota bacterium]